MAETHARDIREGLIGGRFRVDAELGHGGMARVLRVLDERSGEPYALKQLTASGERAATLRAMFQREYHTLAELAHPNIVRAFDFGYDTDNAPYYTMELLDGCDARTLVDRQPLDISRACSLLRDCASALSLVHARRSVHRDVSPRNLWCTSDGRAKLIDFGTLAATGAELRIAGTPPFLAPEAFYRQPLDARCDLYALGAVAYFLLTGRTAYPARNLSELPRLWTTRPERPDALRPEVPAALAELVMALMSLDMRGRPSSASEVFERLSVIAELPSQHAPRIAQAFLSVPALVGREPVMQTLRAQLQRALLGRGGHAALVAQAGLGRSRVLATIALEAKLQGAVTAMAGASSVEVGRLAVASALVERILETLPEARSLCPELAPLLGHLSPRVRSALGDQPLAEMPSQLLSVKLPSAVIKLFDAISERQPLVIAVDDLQRADAASLWVLGRMTLLSRRRRLFIVTTCDVAMLAGAPPALTQLVAPRHRVALDPLSASEVRALLASLFEDAIELESSADWLHELSGGSPQACMQYAQYLVDRGIARYERGRWQLPVSLAHAGLPESLDAVLEQRVQLLSPDARTLALGLALARDRTRAVWQPEMQVPLEAYPQLLDTRDPARANAALDELLHADIVQERDGCYVLGQTAVIDALVRASDLGARRRMHSRLAAVFLQLPAALVWLQVWHLLLADERAHARERVRAFSGQYNSALADWGQMRLSLMAESCMRVLQDYKRNPGTPLEGVLLRQPLLLISSVYDWHLATVGAAQVAQLSRDAGLDLWEQSSTLSPQERLAACVRQAQQRYETTEIERRGMPPEPALRELSYCAFQLSGAFVNSHDLAQLKRLLPVIAPLSAHCENSALLVELCLLANDRLSGRELGERVAELGVTRLYAASGLPPILREGGAGVNIHVQVVEDARRGRSSGFALLELLSAVIGDDMFLVVHGRFLLHAYLGNASEARQLHRQIEVITEDDIWRRNSFLFAEAELYVLLGDLRSLGRAVAAMRTLAERFPGWRAWSLWAGAEQLRLQGDLVGCIRGQEAALQLAGAGEHRAWTRIAPSHADALLEAGEPSTALQRATEIIREAEQLNLDRLVLIEAERVRALAHSRLGDHAGAHAACRRAFEHAAAIGCGGLRLARLHELGARLAVARDDDTACVAALHALWTLIEHTDSPRFISAYESLRHARRVHGETRNLPGARPAETDTTHSQYMTSLDELQGQLRTMAEASVRARRALSLLLEDAGSQAGRLFLLDARGLFEAASLGAVDAADLLPRAARFLDSRLSEMRTITESETLQEQSAWESWPGTSLHAAPVLLFDCLRDPPLAIGVAMIGAAASGESARAPRAELVTMLSQLLLGLGEVSPIALASD